jgi:molybdopterin-guanine dinucleotide biosynthesis protein MobB
VKTFGIVGRKNSGKTHLVVRLVGELRRRGLTVSTVKHTHHHDIELDVPGKDSWRHREAGAHEVIVASDRRWSLVHAGAADAPPVALDALLARLSPCDLVLVEGYKGFTRHPRIEVHRAAAAGVADGVAVPAAAPEPLAVHDAGIVALACPAGQAPASWPPTAARLDLDDTGAIADYILSYRA